MLKIVYIEHSGRAHQVEVAPGTTVMQGARRNSIPGIDAECGGACACATCHVYIDGDWFGRLDPPDDDERSMLDFAVGLEATSRLACQIVMTEALDGLTVRTPESQN